MLSNVKVRSIGLHGNELNSMQLFWMDNKNLGEAESPAKLGFGLSRGEID